MEASIHNALLDVPTASLERIKKWASDQCDYDRYMRKVETNRTKAEFWNGRLQAHMLIKSEADCVLGMRRENRYSENRRGAEGQPLERGAKTRVDSRA